MSPEHQEVTLGEVSRDLAALRQEFTEFRKEQHDQLGRLPDKEYLQLVVDTMQRNVDLQVAATRASADTQIVLVRTESEARDTGLQQQINEQKTDIESLQSNNRWLIRLVASAIVVAVLSAVFHISTTASLTH